MKRELDSGKKAGELPFFNTLIPISKPLNENNFNFDFDKNINLFYRQAGKIDTNNWDPSLKSSVSFKETKDNPCLETTLYHEKILPKEIILANKAAEICKRNDIDSLIDFRKRADVGNLTNLNDAIENVLNVFLEKELDKTQKAIFAEGQKLGKDYSIDGVNKMFSLLEEREKLIVKLLEIGDPSKDLKEHFKKYSSIISQLNDPHKLEEKMVKNGNFLLYQEFVEAKIENKLELNTASSKQEKKDQLKKILRKLETVKIPRLKCAYWARKGSSRATTCEDKTKRRLEARYSKTEKKLNDAVEKACELNWFTKKPKNLKKCLATRKKATSYWSNYLARHKKAMSDSFKRHQGYTKKYSEVVSGRKGASFDEDIWSVDGTSDYDDSYLFDALLETTGSDADGDLPGFFPNEDF